MKTIRPPDNRAVSALFRVFGGPGEPLVADTGELAGCRGMHRGENAALSWLVPLTVFAAISEPLAAWFGTPLGYAVGLPAAFVALNILPFLLGAKSPVGQWRLWFTACVLWAVWRCHAGALSGFFSYLWIGLAIVNFVAIVVLGWQASMRWRGKSGIAWRIALVVSLHAAAIALGFFCGWKWGIAAGLAIAGAFCKAVLDPSSQWLGKVVRNTDLPQPLITIDDGPDRHDTPILLDLLDQFSTKAVFFVIGEKARAHPELIREIVRRGHEIGNHTLTHPAGSFWCAGPWRTFREIHGCQEIVREITGTAPRWFRAPVGHRNLFTHPIASALGMQVMGWTRRGYDAVATDPAKVLARILPIAAGDIVLVHEATPIAAEVIDGVLSASHVKQDEPPINAGESRARRGDA